MVTRCAWVGSDPLYCHYHDTEWGIPVYDDHALFEKLILDGFQAGLSWITVLRKREHFFRVMAGFDPEQIAQWSDEKLHELMQDRGIIRNRLKIEAARTNAQVYLQLMAQQSFSTFLWEFVDGHPRQNQWKTLDSVPTETIESRCMSRALKKAGFRFCGPTICYAFMQAVGMVNDHTVDCFRYPEIFQHAETTGKSTPTRSPQLPLP